jgi:hypothetical protein
MSKRMLILVACLALAAPWATTAENRFEGLVDPTLPLQLSLKGVSSESLGLRVDTEAVQRLAGGYLVSSILIRGEAPVAFVNNQQVSVGSEIDGAVVASIDREGVTLTRGIEEFRVTLYGDSPKRKRSNDD